MKMQQVWMVGLALGAFTASGCNHAVEGARQDAADGAIAAKDTLKDAGTAAQQAASSAADSATKSAEKATGEVSSAANRAADRAAEQAVVAADAARRGAHRVVQVTMVEPKVRAAIDADSALAAPTNQIHVSSRGATIVLEGTVQSEANRQHAAELAARTLREAGAASSVDNRLAVR